MSGTYDMEQWNGTERKDGVRIERVHGGWAVVAPRNRHPGLAFYCPCCERQMSTEHEARVVANVLFPSMMPDPWSPC